MRITISITARMNDDGGLINLEVAPDTTIGILKESVQGETQIPKSSQSLYHNGHSLNDESKTMQQLQIGDGEMLAIYVRESGNSGQSRNNHPQQLQQGARSAGYGSSDYETIRLQLLGNPVARAQALSQRPEIAGVLESPERFAALLQRITQQEREEQARRRQQIADLNADPFDYRAQARIEEMIREERVQENLQNAIEHNPEVFGYVHMLYIDVEVNGVKVKAFVDSGAQATIMSPSCAESCGIMRLVDKRFAGVARGVGTASIIGKVHSAQIKIGTLFLACSFTVMEGKDVDLLLGLDMLKRHQACIDLSRDRLVIQDVEVPFLGEADIPKNMELVRAEEPKIAGPGGSYVGAKSGVVYSPPDTEQSAASSSTPTIGTETQTNVPPQPSFPPESIDQLVALGFSRGQAVHALVACGGNLELAAGLLFHG